MELFQLVEREIHWKAEWKLPLDAEQLVESFPHFRHSILEKLRQKGILPPEIPGFDALVKIGRGGMGVVYRATETRLNRVVALKVIRPDRVIDPDHARQFRQRFQDEAEKMAAVSHPHVVQVFQAGQVGEQVFLAMEYVSGETLQARINREGKLGFREAAEVVEKIALGVAAVHVTGTIHRDLKPDNVLLSDKGVPKVADFGLARQIEQTDGATVEGVFRGTPEYVSPEQAAMGSQPLTERTDVYGLGGILYACLTERPPFPSDSLLAMLRRVVHDPVKRIRELRPDCPKDLETICLKCLEKDQKRRYPSAVELAEDLRRYQEGRPIMARPVGVLEKGWLWARRNRELAGALASTLLILLGSAIGFGGLSWWALAEKANAVEKESMANEKTVEANQETKIAEEQRKKAEVNLYISKIQQAKNEWNLADPKAAHAILGGIPFEKRGWEHAYLFTQMQKNQTTLGEHEGVGKVSLSPNGKHLISANTEGDGTIKLWDVCTGNQIYTIEGVCQETIESLRITSICFSPDGKTFASASSDDCLVLWDTICRKKLKLIKEKKGAIVDIAFCPGGKRIAYVNSYGEIKLWAFTAGQEIQTINEHLGNYVTCIRFSSDGGCLATGNAYGYIKLWNANTGKEIQFFKGHLDKINSLSFASDGKFLASGSDDKTIKLWNLSTGQEIHTFNGHTKEVHTVGFSPDGKHLVSASNDKSIKIWDINFRRNKSSFKNIDGIFRDFSFSPNGKVLALASSSNSVKMINLESENNSLYIENNESDTANNKKLELSRTYPNSKVDSFSEPPIPPRMLFSHIASLQFSKDSKKIAFVVKNCLAQVFDATNGKSLFILKGHTDDVNCVRFSPNNKLLATGSSNCSVKIWDSTAGNLTKNLVTYSGPVLSIAFSSDGNLLASACSDGTVYIWDALNWTIQKTLVGHENRVQTVCFSPVGRLLATGSYDRTIRLWETTTGAEITKLQGHSGPVSSVDFSPDGKILASGSFDKSIIYWDTQSKQELLTFFAHEDKINEISFSPDGNRLASASDDGVVKLWDFIFGQEIFSLPMEKGGGLSVDFSPDGKFLASGSDEGCVSVWDGSLELDVRSILGHTEIIDRVIFNSTDQYMASISDDGVVKIWDSKSWQDILTLKAKSIPSHFCFSLDGKRVAFSVDNKFFVWNCLKTKKILFIDDLPGDIEHLNFSNNSKEILVKLFSGISKAWCIESGVELPCDSITYKPYSDRVISGAALNYFSLVNVNERIFFFAEFGNIRLTNIEKFNYKKKIDFENLLDWHKPNPEWHLKQAKESESAKLPITTAFHLAWARRCGAWQPQVTTDLWKNLQATESSPAMGRLQAQVLGEDVGRMILAGTSATQGNMAMLLTGLR